MKNNTNTIKIVLLTLLFFAQQRTFAPLRPISEDDIPRKFLPNLKPLRFVWPAGHAEPRPLSIVPFREAYKTIENADGSTAEINLATTKKIVIFWLKPEFIKNPARPVFIKKPKATSAKKRKYAGGAALIEAPRPPVEYTKGEAILIPVELICSDRLDISEFMVSDAAALSIKLYKDEQIIFPETLDNWRNIVGLNFMYYLLSEDIRIPWGAERRFPAGPLPTEKTGINRILTAEYSIFFGTSGSWGSSVKK